MQTQFIVASRGDHAEIDRLDSLHDAFVYLDAVRAHGWVVEGPPPQDLGVFAVVVRPDGEEVLDADLAALVAEEPTAAE
jgi:hypothetical protein